MNKRKFILGILIVISMAICGVFWNNSTPQVFAEEITTEQPDFDINEAGSFTGAGYYEVEKEVKLTATMNPGYQFEAWVLVDEDGTETILSTSLEYTFVVEKNVVIKPRVTRLQYGISFDDSLGNVGANELRDFTYEIVNQNRTNGKNHYNDKIEIELRLKDGKYIDDLSFLVDIDNSNTDTTISEMNLDIKQTTQQVVGFRSAVISFNIKDNVKIDMDYIYQYVLTIKSLNDIDIAKCMPFIQLSSNLKLLNANEYKYLIRADQQVTITTLYGNNIYYYESSQFQGQQPSETNTKSYTLYQDSWFGVNYLKHVYSVSFNSYLNNLYGQKDLIKNGIYAISTVKLTAGDTIGFDYDETTKQIMVTTASATNTYNYPTDLFGYNFVGFAIAGEVLNDNTHTISETQPESVEIQLVFEYIEYQFAIELIDEDVDNIATQVVYNNDYNKLVTGTQITVQATTNQYTIKGWSFTASPEQDGYADLAESCAKTDVYMYIFKPISDDNSQVYTIYLDLEYSYLSVEYNLKSSSVTKNLDYDVVSVDTVNKTITFNDSEGKKESKIVVYADKNVTTQDGLTTISTLEMGDVEIADGKLSYYNNMVKNTSLNKTIQEGVDVYTFNKYTYFGDLRLGVIENITLTESGEQLLVDFNGKIYSSQTETTGQASVLRSFTSTKTYNTAKDAYEIVYYTEDSGIKTSVLTMYLYMNGDVYDYIVLRNIEYYYDSTTDKFVTRNLLSNEPQSVEAVITKKDTYSITLNNLLANDILVYFSKTSNEINYSFVNYTNKTGTSLWSFVDNQDNVCILNSTTTEQLNVNYRQLANNVGLLINMENAYDYNNLLFTVAGSEGTVYGSGNVISAKNDEIITITINRDSISKGYQFENYMFQNVDVTNREVGENPYVLKIVMDASKYANQIINVCFSAIEYTININYINDAGELVSPDEANGSLGLEAQGKESSISVNIANESGYIFKAVASNGYYVAKAYIGAQAYTLAGLIGSNSSSELETIWHLNIDNFEQAIIIPAGEGTEINLYINFTTHTYSVRVYFEISSNATTILYPTLKINNLKHNLISKIEDGTSKYYVEAHGYKYDSTVRFVLENFMAGITIHKWCDAEGSTLLEYNAAYTANNIKGNIVLKVVLQYLTYNINFISLDDEGKSCKYGEGQLLNGVQSFELYDYVDYFVTIGQGYVLKQKYYYDAMGQIGQYNIDSGFEFNPANFQIENGSLVKIYLVFALKEINLNIANIVEGELYYFKGCEANELVSYTASRIRGDIVEDIDVFATNKFLTGDRLIMEITPISIGVKLNKINLGRYVIEFGNTIAHSLIVIEEKDNSGKVIGLSYELSLEFTPQIMDPLSVDKDNTIQNVVSIKSFDIVYKYNYIDYLFGISLTREIEGGSRATGNPDMVMEVSGLGFGSYIIFGCSWAGMNTGEGAKFVIDGYSIAGIAQKSNMENDRFVFDDIELWNQVALNQYLKNSTVISVVLNLRPKITLHNYTKYSEENGYVYDNTVYNGEEQGLISGVDVEIGGDFEIIIEYYKNNIEVDTYPVDAGIYDVSIKAIINANIPAISFDENVSFIISKAPVIAVLKTIGIQNKLTKIYGEADSLYKDVIAEDIIFKNAKTNQTLKNLYIDKTSLQIRFMGYIVCDSCDIQMSGMSLKGDSNNYQLAGGENTTFPQVGKIIPKTLEIRGYKISNKVYDGKKDVYVNINDIIYDTPIGNDDVHVQVENLKFCLENYSIGKDREVSIEWDYDTVLIGADRYNYTLSYKKVSISVHPYELTYELNGYGTFKVVDRDRKGLIPIGSKLIVHNFENGSSEYRSIYGLVGPQIQQGQKLTSCFEVIIQLESMNLQVSEGLYIYIPKVEKVANVTQVYDDDFCESLTPFQDTGYTCVKVVKGNAVFGVISNTTYLPLWAIILIIIGALLVILAIVIIFIIVRRKTHNKYSKYDKI